MSVTRIYSKYSPSSKVVKLSPVISEDQVSLSNMHEMVTRLMQVPTKSELINQIILKHSEIRSQEQEERKALLEDDMKTVTGIAHHIVDLTAQVGHLLDALTESSKEILLVETEIEKLWDERWKVLQADPIDHARSRELGKLILEKKDKLLELKNT